MNHTPDEVTAATLAEASACLDRCLDRIEHATRQLNDVQVWWRHDESLNSIGNLLLHLAGNVRQWIICGLGGAADLRDRPAEFSQRETIPTDALLRRLRATVDEAKAVLAGADAEAMMRVRRVQGFDVNGWGVIFDCIPHFQGHTQEIIGLTRMQLGETYQFYWQPSTPEQGAPR